MVPAQQAFKQSLTDEDIDLRFHALDRSSNRAGGIRQFCHRAWTVFFPQSIKKIQDPVLQFAHENSPLYWWDLSSVSQHCHLVKLDVRPAAHVSIRSEVVNAAIDLIRKNRLSFSIFQNCATHRELYIYRHPHLENVIRHIRKISDKNDQAFAGWCAGKLFGYSEDAIGRWIGELR